MEENIKKILKNVEFIPKCGIPGSLVVFEQKLAYPVLTGDDSCSVVFAAAEYGNGRVFVTSHESFISNFIRCPKDFGTLWQNIKDWLLKNETIQDEDIRSVEEYESVSDIPENVRLLRWNGVINKTELYIAQLLKKYVSNGGAVICGCCGWGWLSLNQNRTLDEMSLNKFITYCGICFGSEPCSNELSYFEVANNLAIKSHFGESISRLAKNINAAIEIEDMLINGINSMPLHIASKYMEKLHRVIYPYILLHYKPSYKMSVTDPIGRSLLSICSKVYEKMGNCGIKIKAPNIEEFPGSYSDINYPEIVQTAIVTVKSKFDEFHCTGYYMAAGSLVNVTVLEGSISGWELRVSSHVDDISSSHQLNRWPIVSLSMKLKKFMTITSAFGGIIYLDSPKGNCTIRLKLENVIETPFYDLNLPETIKNWNHNSKSAGLWAELCGKHVVFTCPSQFIRNIADPSKILKLWDLIVIANHELRGTDVKGTWRERIVVDIQPFNSTLHSGYPITIPYDYIQPESHLYIFDETKVRNNGWALIHEIGHNFQRPCWTPMGTEEVTVNIFTLHVFHLVFKLQPTIQQIKEKIDEARFKKFVDNDFKFEEWKKNPYIGLLIFGQLINSFGWNAFKILFREYESLSEKDKVFTNDLDKWDQWILRLSNIVGLDISPLFYFWNIPFSEKPGTNLSDLTPWLPNDEITKQFTKRVDYVKSNFNGLLLGNETLYTSCPIVMYPDDFVFDSIDKLDSLKTFY